MARSVREVYAAEWGTVGEVSRRFPTMEEVRAYVLDLTTSDWWMETFPSAPLGVEVETRSSTARFALAVNGRHIAIPNSPRGRTLSTVLHELAHLACGANTHGYAFQKTMLELVRHEMGYFSYIELQTAYGPATI